MDRLYVGAAKREITPEASWFPMYRNARKDVNCLDPDQKDNMLAGVLDPLFVRVIALEDSGKKALLISFDLIGVPDGESKVQMLSEAFGIPGENIFIVATHTHNVPMLGRNGKLKDAEPFHHILQENPQIAEKHLAFEAKINDQLKKAVMEALSSMQPARMGIGYADSYINVNRDQKYNGIYKMGFNGSGPSDKTAALIRFENEEGKPIALFANYGCHCVIAYLNRCLEGGKSGVTADLAGFVSTAYEMYYPGTVCIWSPASAGNQNPIFMNFFGWPDIMTGEVREGLIQAGNTDYLKVLGARHLADLKTAESRIDTWTDHIDIKAKRDVLMVPVDPEKKGSMPRVTIDGKQRLIVTGLALGDIFLYGIGGELYCDIGEKLKALSEYPDTLICTLCIASAGYLMDDEDLTAPTLFADRMQWRPGYIRPMLEQFLTDCQKEMREEK